MNATQPNNFRQSIKKIFNFFKSENTNSDDYSEVYSQEFRKPYISSRNMLLHDRPVRVHVALTRSIPGENTERLISKQSLTELMRNDTEFNSFVNNQYKLKSTVIVEGVKEHGDDKSIIYINDSIPVSLRRRFNGKKKNKEITIRCKLYKADRNSYPNGKFFEESDTVVSPRTMRKVEVPLTELRSSLNGFTRRLSTFEKVPWLTAVHHLPQRRSTMSGGQINLEQPSTYKSPEYRHYYKKQSEDVKLQYEAIEHTHNIESKLNKSKKSVSFPSGLKSGMYDFVRIDNDNDTFSELKTMSTKWKENNNFVTKLQKLKSHVKISSPIIRQTTPFRNRKVKLPNNNKSKHTLSEYSFETALNEFDPHNKKLLKLTQKNNIKADNLKRSVLKDSISSKKNCKEFVNLISTKNDSLPKKCIGGCNPTCMHVQEVNETEEIPVTSIVITRSRTRLIKYDDGTDIEEKLGRQTIRVDAPPGTLYAHYTPNNTLLTDSQLSRESHDTSSQEQELFCVSYPEIDLKQEQKVSDESRDKYSEIISDLYNPLSWLYSHYNKAKSLILPFSNKN